LDIGKQKIMLKEAKYYSKLEQKKIKCTLCPHECILNIGQTGICRTRKNIDGKLYTLAFSNPVAINIDPIEKKPLYHFLPTSRTFSIATAGCNLRCKNCQNATISQVSPEQTNNYNLEPKQIIDSALKNNCKSIAYTYTDPVVFYEYALETAKLAKKNGLKNIIVSAGYINQKPLEELCQFIDAANIDLKSFDDNLYKKLNSARLQPVLETLKTLRKKNIWLEITNLLIPGFNDNEQMIDKMTKWLAKNGFDETPLHFSKFYPTYKLSNIAPTPLETIEKAIQIARQNGLKYIYGGNIWGHNSENTYCPNCNNIIISRNSYNTKIKAIENGKCTFCGKKINGVWL
jgi:pyruvate formate lyase activating enzyme